MILILLLTLLNPSTQSYQSVQNTSQVVEYGQVRVETVSIEIEPVQAPRDWIEYLAVVEATQEERDWVYGIVMCESTGNPYAKNPSSPASGLCQYLPSTWRGANARYFPDRVMDIWNEFDQIDMTLAMYRAGRQREWVCNNL